MVLKSSSLKCFVSMNLFSDFKFKINLLLPFFFCTIKYEDKYSPSQDSHSDIAPEAQRSSIASRYCFISVMEHVGSEGTRRCSTGLENGILYPSIHDRITASSVMMRH